MLRFTIREMSVLTQTGAGILVSFVIREAGMLLRYAMANAPLLPCAQSWDAAIQPCRYRFGEDHLFGDGASTDMVIFMRILLDRNDVCT